MSDNGLEWAMPKYIYFAKGNLYTPRTPGFSIRQYKSTRFYATRGGGQKSETRISKCSVHDTIEEAKAWLDSLPERPTVEMLTNFRYMQNIF